MKIYWKNVVTGEEGIDDAELTGQGSASSYGFPVLYVDGMPFGTDDATLAGFRLYEATSEERKILRRGGYDLPDYEGER